MDSTQIGLFDLAERRLAWADRRQALLAQNILLRNPPARQATGATYWFLFRRRIPVARRLVVRSP